jgi:hypothetical protein
MIVKFLVAWGTHPEGSKSNLNNMAAEKLLKEGIVIPYGKLPEVEDKAVTHYDTKVIIPPKNKGGRPRKK